MVHITSSLHAYHSVFTSDSSGRRVSFDYFAHPLTRPRKTPSAVSGDGSPSFTQPQPQQQPQRHRNSLLGGRKNSAGENKTEEATSFGGTMATTQGGEDDDDEDFIEDATNKRKKGQDPDRGEDDMCLEQRFR